MLISTPREPIARRRNFFDDGGKTNGFGEGFRRYKFDKGKTIPLTTLVCHAPRRLAPDSASSYRDAGRGIQRLGTGAPLAVAGFARPREFWGRRVPSFISSARPA